MKLKGKKIVLVFNIILFALLFGSISLNKEIIRPLYAHLPLVGLITGSFPNFIAAFIISLIFMNGIVTKKPKHERLLVYISSILVFLILAVEELKPMWGVSKQYDLFDIIASGIGSFLAIIIFEIIVSRQKKVKMFA